MLTLTVRYPTPSAMPQRRQSRTLVARVLILSPWAGCRLTQRRSREQRATTFIFPQFWEGVVSLTEQLIVIRSLYLQRCKCTAKKNHACIYITVHYIILYNIFHFTKSFRLSIREFKLPDPVRVSTFATFSLLVSSLIGW